MAKQGVVISVDGEVVFETEDAVTTVSVGAEEGQVAQFGAETINRIDIRLARPDGLNLTLAEVQAAKNVATAEFRAAVTGEPVEAAVEAEAEAPKLDTKTSSKKASSND